jgi:small subunit ribosomal protein S3Ae
MPRIKRRKVDTWKTKDWYEVFAPKAFGEVKIADTPASNPEDLKGRTVETTMKDITGDFSKQYIKLKFQVEDVKGKKAYTVFKRQSLSREYMRSQIRRKSTRVEGVSDVVTKDGKKLRVKAIALALGRAQVAQEKAIRKKMHEIVEKAAKEKDLEQFVREVVQGSVSIEMYRAAGKIFPLKRVEIRKVRVL